MMGKKWTKMFAKRFGVFLSVVLLLGLATPMAVLAAAGPVASVLSKGPITIPPLASITEVKWTNSIDHPGYDGAYTEAKSRSNLGVATQDHVFVGSNNSVQFMGYESPSHMDYIYSNLYTDYSALSGIEFTLKPLNMNFHTFRQSGFFFNGTLAGNTYTGYALALTQPDGAYASDPKASLNIYKGTWSIGNDGNYIPEYCKVTTLKSGIANGSTTPLNVRLEKLTNANGTKTTGGFNIYLDGRLVFSVSDAAAGDIGTGFGFYTSYYSHYCSVLTTIKYEGIKLKQVRTPTSEADFDAADKATVTANFLTTDGNTVVATPQSLSMIKKWQEYTVNNIPQSIVLDGVTYYYVSSDPSVSNGYKSTVTGNVVHNFRYAQISVEKSADIGNGSAANPVPVASEQQYQYSVKVTNGQGALPTTAGTNLSATGGTYATDGGDGVNEGFGTINQSGNVGQTHYFGFEYDTKSSTQPPNHYYSAYVTFPENFAAGTYNIKIPVAFWIGEGKNSVTIGEGTGLHVPDSTFTMKLRESTTSGTERVSKTSSLNRYNKEKALGAGDMIDFGTITIGANNTKLVLEIRGRMWAQVNYGKPNYIVHHGFMVGQPDISWSSVSLEDTLPAGLQYVSQASGGGTVVTNGQKITWTPASFSNGAPVEFKYNVKVNSTTVNQLYDNTANLRLQALLGTPATTIQGGHTYHKLPAVKVSAHYVDRIDGVTLKADDAVVNTYAGNTYSKTPSATLTYGGKTYNYIGYKRDGASSVTSGNVSNYNVGSADHDFVYVYELASGYGKLNIKYYDTTNGNAELTALARQIESPVNAPLMFPVSALFDVSTGGNTYTSTGWQFLGTSGFPGAVSPTPGYPDEAQSVLVPNIPNNTSVYNLKIYVAKHPKLTIRFVECDSAGTQMYGGAEIKTAVTETFPYSGIMYLSDEYYQSFGTYKYHGYVIGTSGTASAGTHMPDVNPVTADRTVTLYFENTTQVTINFVELDNAGRVLKSSIAQVGGTFTAFDSLFDNILVEESADASASVVSRNYIYQGYSRPDIAGGAVQAGRPTGFSTPSDDKTVTLYFAANYEIGLKYHVFATDAELAVDDGAGAFVPTVLLPDETNLVRGGQSWTAQAPPATINYNGFIYNYSGYREGSDGGPYTIGTAVKPSVTNYRGGSIFVFVYTKGAATVTNTMSEQFRDNDNLFNVLKANNTLNVQNGDTYTPASGTPPDTLVNPLTGKRLGYIGWSWDNGSAGTSTGGKAVLPSATVSAPSAITYLYNANRAIFTASADGIASNSTNADATTTTHVILTFDYPVRGVLRFEDLDITLGGADIKDTASGSIPGSYISGGGTVYTIPVTPPRTALEGDAISVAVHLENANLSANPQYPYTTETDTTKVHIRRQLKSVTPYSNAGLTAYIRVVFDPSGYPLDNLAVENLHFEEVGGAMAYADKVTKVTSGFVAGEALGYVFNIDIGHIQLDSGETGTVKFFANGGGGRDVFKVIDDPMPVTVEKPFGVSSSEHRYWFIGERDGDGWDAVTDADTPYPENGLDRHQVLNDFIKQSNGGMMYFLRVSARSDKYLDYTGLTAYDNFVLGSYADEDAENTAFKSVDLSGWESELASRRVTVGANENGIPPGSYELLTDGEEDIIFYNGDYYIINYNATSHAVVGYTLFGGDTSNMMFQTCQPLTAFGAIPYGIYIDGALVPYFNADDSYAVNYGVYDGSGAYGPQWFAGSGFMDVRGTTFFYLQPDYIDSNDKLANGKHEIFIMFEDGYALGEFTKDVRNPAEIYPETLEVERYQTIIAHTLLLDGLPEPTVAPVTGSLRDGVTIDNNAPPTLSIGTEATQVAETFSFELKATNLYSDTNNPAIAEITVRVIDIPGEVSDFSATPAGENTTRLSWNVPDYLGNTPLLGYDRRIKYFYTDTKTWSNGPTLYPTTQNFYDVTLPDGVSAYQFDVWAVNKVGTGPEIHYVGIPVEINGEIIEIPRNEELLDRRVLEEHDDLFAGLALPLVEVVGSLPTGVTLDASIPGAPKLNITKDATKQIGDYPLTLKVTTDYGDPATADYIVRVIDKPSVPLNLTAGGTGTITATWVVPSYLGNTPLLGYGAKIVLYKDGAWSQWQDVNTDPNVDVTSLDFILPNDVTAYGVQIWAYNKLGAGPSAVFVHSNSDPGNPPIPPLPPGGAIGGSVTNDSGELVDVDVVIARGDKRLSDASFNGLYDNINDAVSLEYLEPGGIATFLFEHIPDGYYNIIARVIPLKETGPGSGVYDRDETRSYYITRGVEVENSEPNATVDIELGRKQSVLEISPDAPNVSVLGLPELFNTAFYTEADSILVDGGGVVEFKLLVNKVESDAEDAMKIALKARDNSERSMFYLDLTLIKSCYATDGSLIEQTLIQELPDDYLLISIPISGILAGRTTVHVYRVHVPIGLDEQMHQLEILDGLKYANAGDFGSEGFRSSDDTTWVVMKTNKFSAYGLSVPAYQLTVTTEGNGSVLGIPEDNLLIENEGAGFSAAADQGWHFAKWIVQGAASPASETDPAMALIMPANEVAVTAVFEKDPADSAPFDPSEPPEPPEPPETPEPKADDPAPFDPGVPPAPKAKVVEPGEAEVELPSVVAGNTNDKTTDSDAGDVVVSGEPEVVPETDSGWALLNLIFALIGILTAIVAAILRIRRSKDEKDGKTKDAPVWLSLLAFIPALIGILLFFILEDITGKMFLTDVYTILFAVILCLVIALTVVANRLGRRSACNQRRGMIQ
ncbi:MAG: DUF11 domain-containing protein [Clostridiales Family XIII bacterium]|nr:DUF11 domain-containing protein [Clostridiales Family XIII bacterium]